MDLFKCKQQISDLKLNVDFQNLHVLPGSSRDGFGSAVGYGSQADGSISPARRKPCPERKRDKLDLRK